jgi:hypothetical protein
LLEMDSTVNFGTSRSKLKKFEVVDGLSMIVLIILDNDIDNRMDHPRSPFSRLL